METDLLLVSYNLEMYVVIHNTVPATCFVLLPIKEGWNRLTLESSVGRKEMFYCTLYSACLRCGMLLGFFFFYSYKASVRSPLWK